MDSRTSSQTPSHYGTSQSTILDRTTITDQTSASNDESFETRKKLELGALTNAANMQKPTLPDFNMHFTDGSIETNNRWLNCLNRFTSNFKKMPLSSNQKEKAGENNSSKDCLALLHRLTFSKFSETRFSAQEPYEKWTKLVKDYFPDFKWQVLYQCPQQSNFLHYLSNSMTKAVSKEFKYSYRGHTQYEKEQYHHDIAIQNTGFHFRLHSTEIWASTTMLNYWLKLTERASRYPRDHKLFYSASKMYTDGYLQYWPTDGDLKKFKLLKFPFTTYMRSYTGAKQPENNVLDGKNYTVHFFKAALHCYALFNDKEGFQKFFESAVLTIQSSSTNSTWLEFLTDSLKKYPEYIDLPKFTETRHYKDIVDAFPIDALELFHKCDEKLLSLQKNFLSKIDSWKELENVSEKLPDSENSDLLNLIEDQFDSSSKFLPDMAEFLINDCITDADHFRNKFADFVSRVEMGKSLDQNKVEFLLKIVKEGVYKNYITFAASEFEDLICRTSQETPKFLYEMFTVFSRTSNTETHAELCSILANKMDHLPGDVEMSDPHVLKVFVRHMIHDLEIEMDDEDQLERFKMFFLGNVDENVLSEVENWFGKENVEKLKLKLGIVDESLEMAATPSEHGDVDGDETMVSQEIVQSQSQKLDLTEVPPDFMDISPPVIKSQSLEVGNSDSDMISENSKSEWKEENFENDEKLDDEPISENEELETTAHEISIQTSFKEIDLTDDSSSQDEESQGSENPESDNSENPVSDNSENPESDSPEHEILAAQSLLTDDSQDPTFEVQSSQESLPLIPEDNNIRRSARKKIANSSKVKRTARTTPRKLIKSPNRKLKTVEKIEFSSSESEDEEDKQNDKNKKNTLPEAFQKPVDSSDKENDPENEQNKENGRLTPTESQENDKHSNLQVPKFNAGQVTPTRSILKINNVQVMTPNSRRRSVMFEQKNNIAYSDSGLKSAAQLVSDTKDTRGSKKRKQIAAARGMNQGVNQGMSPNRPVQAGNTPGIQQMNQRSGFLSRGFRLLQAARGLSPKPVNPNNPSNAQKQANLQPGPKDANLKDANFKDSSFNQPKTSTQIPDTESSIPQNLSGSMVRDRSCSPLNIPPVKARKIEKETRDFGVQVQIENFHGCEVPKIATDPKECVCSVEIRSATLFWMARSLVNGLEPDRIRDKAIAIFGKQEILEAYRAVCKKCNMTINESDTNKTSNQLCREIQGEFLSE
jgi:hypothetical protein